MAFKSYSHLHHVLFFYMRTKKKLGKIPRKKMFVLFGLSNEKPHTYVLASQVANIGKLHTTTSICSIWFWKIKFLSSYAQLFSFHFDWYRLITVRYTAPVDHIILKRDALEPIGQKIVKLMYDMSFDTNPIILHVFSNGGAYLYKHIDTAMKEFQSPLDVGSVLTSFSDLKISFFIHLFAFYINRFVA